MAQTTINFSTLKTNFSWADDEILTEDKLDNIFGVDGTTGLQDFCDDVNDNIDQLGLDTFGSGYVFDNDGAANYTGFSLYDKQTIVDSYTGGDVTISATGAWTDVDATNAAVVFTPVLLSGDFRVTFSFSVESVTSNATNETDVRFRLTDSTTQSTQLPRIKLITGVTTTTNTSPITLTYTYDGLSVASKTVKLQYFITTSTASVIKVHANSNDPILMEVEKV